MVSLFLDATDHISHIIVSDDAADIPASYTPTDIIPRLLVACRGLSNCLAPRVGCPTFSPSVSGKNNNCGKKNSSAGDADDHVDVSAKQRSRLLRASNNDIKSLLVRHVDEALLELLLALPLSALCWRASINLVMGVAGFYFPLMQQLVERCPLLQTVFVEYRSSFSASLLNHKSSSSRASRRPMFVPRSANPCEAEDFCSLILLRHLSHLRITGCDGVVLSDFLRNVVRRGARSLRRVEIVSCDFSNHPGYRSRDRSSVFSAAEFIPPQVEHLAIVWCKLACQLDVSDLFFSTTAKPEEATSEKEQEEGQSAGGNNSKRALLALKSLDLHGNPLRAFSPLTPTAGKDQLTTLLDFKHLVEEWGLLASATDCSLRFLNLEMTFVEVANEETHCPGWLTVLT